MKGWIIGIFLSLTVVCFAESASQTVQAHSSVKIEGKTYPYTVSAGMLTVSDDKGKAQARHSYTYYRLTEGDTKRPLTFCFNGGPGSSSIWLHLGAFGPKRWLKEQGHLEENPASLLSETDLVFVDPVGTGWSQVAEGVEEDAFLSVEGDIAELSCFIHTFLNEFKRWESPKYLLGESYGTFRAIGLCDHLAEKHQITLDGLILISSIFDLQWVSFDSLSNKLPYLLFTPSMAAVAQQKGKLSAAYQKMPLEELLTKCQAFCYRRYLPALYLGDSFPKNEKEQVAEELSLFLGIPKEELLAYQLQIHPAIFRKRLAKEEGKQLGRFDGREEGFSCRPTGEWSDADPSYDTVMGPLASAFNHYMREELGWQGNERYRAINPSILGKWKWCENKGVPSHVLDELKCSLLYYPKMKVLIASGYYDLATPFTGAQYALQQMHLPKEIRQNIRLTYYKGGHMMYLDPKVARQLHSDLHNFYSKPPIE
jgi:carboxypeptidase C (cathepsin A)